MSYGWRRFALCSNYPITRLPPLTRIPRALARNIYLSSVSATPQALGCCANRVLLDPGWNRRRDPRRTSQHPGPFSISTSEVTFAQGSTPEHFAYSTVLTTIFWKNTRVFARRINTQHTPRSRPRRRGYDRISESTPAFRQKHKERRPNTCIHKNIASTKNAQKRFPSTCQ